MYTIKVDENGLNAELSPVLVQLARNLPVYISTRSEVLGPPWERQYREVGCIRCVECESTIFPEDLVGRVSHLTREHGYRMDGRQYDNQGKEISHGDDEASLVEDQ